MCTTKNLTATLVLLGGVVRLLAQETSPLVLRPVRALAIRAAASDCASDAASEWPANTERGSDLERRELPGDALAGQEFRARVDYDPNCAADTLSGQNPSACGSTQWFFYSDLNFCNGTLCQRTRVENYPAPGFTITAPIGIISWEGLFIDAGSNGCTPSPGGDNFRIRFYQDSGNLPANPTVGYYTEYVTVTKLDTGSTVLFSGATIPAIVWRFTAVLNNPVSLTTGWFGITGELQSPPRQCWHLWKGSGEGNGRFTQWWEVNDPTYPNGGSPQTTLCDINYCFYEKRMGACCDERANDGAGACYLNFAEATCLLMDGRFRLNETSCNNFNPPCGQGTGPCCQDEPSNPNDPNTFCVLAQFEDCEPPPQPEYCLGDLDCSGTVDFADINAFVKYVSNYPAWVAQYPSCNPKNGDCDCDDQYGNPPDFGDINPFVKLIQQAPKPCPVVCATSRLQGNTWLGPSPRTGETQTGHVCEDCCVVVQGKYSPFVLEGESNDCTVPDTFNGGCDASSPAFTTLTCGTWMYGEAGKYQPAPNFPATANADWYQINVAQASTLEITLEAEFAAQVRLQYANAMNNCATDWNAGFWDVLPCTTTPAVTTRCLPAGYYFVVVTPTELSTLYCKADYALRVVCTGPCTPCSVTCPPPGDPNDPNQVPYNENGPCNPYDPNTPDPNGGCNLTPPVFEEIPFSPLPIAQTRTVCGTVWADENRRDLDWYSFTLAFPSTVSISNVYSEVPIMLTPLVDSSGVAPPPGCSGYYYYPALHWLACDPTGPGNPLTFNFALGTFWLLLAPSTYDGTDVFPIWGGYPCDSGDNSYSFTLSIEPVVCTPCNDCTGEVVENEPPCSDGYVDNFNGGWDWPEPYEFSTFPGLGATCGAGSAVCGQLGSWWAGDPNDPNNRRWDTDWYQLNLTGTTVRRLGIAIKAQMTVNVQVFAAADGPGAGPWDYFDVSPCVFPSDPNTPNFHSTAWCLPAPATYYVRVTTDMPVSCTEFNQYLLWMRETQATIACAYSPCTVTCANGVPTGSPAATNTDDACGVLPGNNEACDLDPPNPNAVMTWVAPSSATWSTVAAYCGVMWTGEYNGGAWLDRDWFRITPANAPVLWFRAWAEYPFKVVLFNGTACNSPLIAERVVPHACRTLVSYSFSPIVANTPYIGYVTIVDSGSGEDVYYGYPCTVPFHNEYKIAWRSWTS